MVTASKILFASFAVAVAAAAVPAAAADTYSYVQYVTTMTWAMGAADKYTYTTDQVKNMASGDKNSTDLGGNPPYYAFSVDNSAKPTWQYPQYLYNQGYSPSLMASCQLGDWQDTALTYDNGPDFLKAYPQEAWTQCSVGASGGLGGGVRWYLFFANVQKDSNGGDVCSSQCLRANYAPYGWASGADAPPCWQKESAGYFSCFDYDSSTGKCPWAGMTDCHTVKPTTAPVTPTTAPVTPTTAPVTPTTAPVTPTTAPVTPTTAAPPQKACANGVKCLRGNWSGAGWAVAPSAPPCWQAEGSGDSAYFSCFDYVNGECPWSGMIDCQRE